MKKYLLITGGAGFIGSCVNHMLASLGHHTLVVDHFGRGHRKNITFGIVEEGDICDAQFLRRLFLSYPIEAIFHFAGYIDVGESVTNPSLYYHNNVTGSLLLLREALLHGVKKVVFSSSAAVYGVPQKLPVREEEAKNPITPYGRSKWMIEQALQDFSASDGMQSVSLRYFNAAGGDSCGQRKNYKERDSNIIPKILRALRGGNNKVTLFGSDYPTFDGTCVRDYIHVEDLARAHILAYEHLLSEKPTTSYNLGNGQGYSLRELFQIIEKVTGENLDVIQGPRRVGDPATLIASSEKAERELGWAPRFGSLEKIVFDAWQSLQHGPNSPVYEESSAPSL